MNAGWRLKKETKNVVTIYCEMTITYPFWCNSPLFCDQNDYISHISDRFFGRAVAGLLRLLLLLRLAADLGHLRFLCERAWNELRLRLLRSGPLFFPWLSPWISSCPLRLLSGTCTRLLPTGRLCKGRPRRSIFASSSHAWW